MGKWCLLASLFIFYRIIIKVAVNQDRRKSLVKFDFGGNQTTHFGVTCPWVTKISHFWTWISLKPVGQSWSNFMCSIIGVGERLHKVLGQIDLGTLDSGERSLPFGLLVTCPNCSTLLNASSISQIRQMDSQVNLSFTWVHLEGSSTSISSIDGTDLSGCPSVEFDRLKMDSTDWPGKSRVIHLDGHVNAPLF